MKVQVAGRIFENYPRTDVLITSLRRLEERGAIELVDETQTEPLWFSEPGSTSRSGLKQQVHDWFPSLYRFGRFLKNRFRDVISAGSVLGRVLGLRQRIRREQPDVVVVAGDNHWLAAGLGLLTSGAETTVVYDLFISEYSRDRDSEELLKPALVSWLKESLVQRAVDHCLVFSREYERFYEREFDVDQSSLHVLPKGCTGEWMERDVNYRVYEDSISETTPFRVIYWGSFLPHHGVDVLLDAAKGLSDRPVEFILCGEGLLKEKYETMAQSMELDNLTFTGFLSLSDLIDEVDRCHLSVGHLSREHDADLIAPNKLVQAMARGRPVVCASSSHIRDFYDLGDNEASPVVFVEPEGQSLADLIEQFVESPDRLEEAGRQARKRVENSHAPDRVSQRLLEILRTINCGKTRK